MERVGRRLAGLSAWRVGAVALLAVCVCLVGTARADAEGLAITSPANGSSIGATTPTFSGTGAASGAIVVEIFKVGDPNRAAEATATTTGGNWSSGSASPALKEGTYTAIALQSEPLATSEEITFTVETIAPPPPTMTLNTPASTSAQPTFSGTASGTKPIVVEIYQVLGAESYKYVASAEGASTAGSWKAGPVSVPLVNGSYIAVATEEATNGGLGATSEADFTIAVAAPTVKINQPTTPSNNPKPTFTGTATGSTTVTVKIYAGATASGTPTTVAATLSKESWSGKVSSELQPGEYTAVASQEGAVTGDPKGESVPVTFTVTKPELVLAEPPPRSGETTPIFPGTTNEPNTAITVKIYAGSATSGTTAATATVTAPASGGSWTSGKASPALKTGEYTAIASQVSSFGASELKSGAYKFAVDTEGPTVTLSPPPKRSNEPEPTFMGTTSDSNSTVTVYIYAGAKPTPPVVAEATAKPSGGTWTTSKTNRALSSGEYTAQATQPSSLHGNDDIGVSAAASFTIETNAPQGSGSTPAPTVVPLAPTASFAWFPTSPHINEPVALVSGSTDPSSAITAFAWDLVGNGKFASGSAVISTSFATAGNHIVQLLVTDANNLSSVATETIPVTLSGPVLMQPFPIVQIISSDTEYGVRLGLLRVQAPVGARITVVCRGRGCPVKAEHAIAAGSKGAVSGRVQFRRYERSLRAGLTLEIRVFKAGEIGKFTRFVVRRGRLPLRTDTCLNPAGTKTMTCPS